MSSTPQYDSPVSPPSRSRMSHGRTACDRCSRLWCNWVRWNQDLKMWLGRPPGRRYCSTWISYYEVPGCAGEGRTWGGSTRVGQLIISNFGMVVVMAIGVAAAGLVVAGVVSVVVVTAFSVPHTTRGAQYLCLPILSSRNRIQLNIISIPVTEYRASLEEV